MQRQTTPRIAVSTTGDIIYIKTGLVFFIPASQLPKLEDGTHSAAILLIADVGAAAIETLLAADAECTADVHFTDDCKISNATLTFKVPSGLTVAYTTDEKLATGSISARALGIDLVVTDTSIGWDRPHAGFIGDVVKRIPPTPPQIVGLDLLDQEVVVQSIREALARRQSTTGGTAS